MCRELVDQLAAALEHPAVHQKRYMRLFAQITRAGYFARGGEERELKFTITH